MKWLTTYIGFIWYIIKVVLNNYKYTTMAIEKYGQTNKWLWENIRKISGQLINY